MENVIRINSLSKFETEKSTIRGILKQVTKTPISSHKSLVLEAIQYFMNMEVQNHSNRREKDGIVNLFKKKKKRKTTNVPSRRLENAQKDLVMVIMLCKQRLSQP